MTTSARHGTNVRHRPAGGSGRAGRPSAHLSPGRGPARVAAGSPGRVIPGGIGRRLADAPALDDPWFWGRYPLFAAITATILEVGTLIGAPLSNPFALGDWNLLRWLVFFCAMLLVAIPIYGTLDRGGGRVVYRWLTEVRGFHVQSCLITAAISIGVGFLGLLVFTWLGPPFQPGDLRAAIVCGIICGSVCWGVLKRRVIVHQVEWGFLLVCLTAGAVLQVALPPYANLTADDRAHLQAALGISYVLDGQFGMADAVVADVDIDPAPWDEGIAPDAPSEEEFSRMFSWESRQRAIEFLDGEVGPDVAGEALAWAGEAAMPSTSGNVGAIGEHDAADGVVDGYIEVEGFSNVRGFSYVRANFLGRVPLAAGLWAGRLIGLPLSGQIVAARVSNLLFYALITFVAIRTLRSGRLVLLPVALFPAIVQLASNLSYDPWMISTLFLGFARLARAIQDDAPMDWPLALRILVPLFLGILVKAAYFPLLVVPFLAPSRLFDPARGGIPRRVFLWAIGGMAGALVLSFLVPMIATGGAATTDTSKFSDVSAYGQLAYIFQHPLRSIKMFLAWLFMFLTPDNLLTSFSDNFIIHEVSNEQIYALLGGPTVAVSFYLMFFGPFFLRDAGDGAYRTKALVIGTGVTVFVVFCLMAVALYLSFTPVGMDTVLGVQGRYIFPMLFPLLLFTFNPKVVMEARRGVVSGVVLILLALLLLSHIWWAVLSWLA